MPQLLMLSFNQFMQLLLMCSVLQAELEAKERIKAQATQQDSSFPLLDSH